MNRLRLVLMIASGLALFACDRGHPADDRKLIGQALNGVLVYPGSAITSMSAGDSVGEVSLSTPIDPDTVADWFRGMLRLNHWDLQADSRQRDGSIAMYAEHAKQPLWITIKAATGGPGTTYTVVGAIVSGTDSGAFPSTDSASQRSGSSKSSNRIHRR
jgi:hypothetical protein